MSEPAFYIPPERWGEKLCLDREETAHARVMRLKTGDKVLALDGKGRMAHCVISGIEKKTTILKLISTYEAPIPKSRAILALALSKAVRRDFFMEKASELGAWEIWLWQARFSQGKMESSTAKSVEARLIAGLKQSRNPWIPVLRVFSGVADVAQAAQNAAWRILPWEEQSGVPILEPEQLGRVGDTVYVIGPEGGFAQEELEILRSAKFCAASLGNRVLRCETAAVLCLGLHWWAAQLPGDARYKGEIA